jgi:hypothetical protein
MRLATTLALALCIALPAPIAANTSDADIPMRKHDIPMHKHRTHTHPSIYGSFNPAAAA